MRYEEFKELVKTEFMSYMSDQFQHMHMEISTVNKVNKIVDAVTFVDKSKDFSAAPTVYVNDMYERFLDVKDHEVVFSEMAAEIEAAFQHIPIKESLDLGNAKNNIVFQLINTEQNKEMLKGMPHRSFLDLSIIYRWVVEIDERGIQSVMIKNDTMEKLGLSEGQLFKAAADNTRRIFPPVIRSMNQVMMEIMCAEGMPEEMVDLMMDERAEDGTMFVITNSAKINGASSILYDDDLHKLAEIVGTDLYILPSSVHETIAVPAKGNPYDLAEMVNEINMSQVSIDERLSNQVYHYDKDLRKLTLATDTPNKRLDGIVAEQQLVYGVGDKSR